MPGILAIRDRETLRDMYRSPGISDGKWVEVMKQRKRRRGEHNVRWPGATFLSVTLLLVLVACGAGSQQPTAHASPTPNARATAYAYVTRTVQAEQQGPVTVQLGAASARQQFNQATQDLTLTADAQVTVTNHTGHPIHLASACLMPIVLLSLGPADLSRRPLVFGPTTNCILENLEDLSPAIAPGGSLRLRAPYDTLESSAPSPLPAGQYILTVTVTFWHQGTLDQISTPGTTLLGGTAEGQTIVTLA